MDSNMSVWIARTIRSKTMNWGHLQIILGAISTVVVLVTPENMPDLPVWIYTSAAMVSGIVTYVLRTITTQPLSEK